MEYIYSERMKNLNGAATREIFKLLTRPEIISFAGGFPSSECLPITEVREIINEILSSGQAVSALQYGSTEGFNFFRQRIIEYVKEVGIDAQLEDILVVSGGQQGIDLMSKVFVNKGDVILVENPTYLSALQIFETYQARVVGVKSTPDGIDLEDLRNKIIEYKPKFLYTVTTFSNPTGKTYTIENRKGIAKITAEFNTMVLEDDPYSKLRFEGTPVPSLKHYDVGGNIVYVSSFSKIISPGLRIGFLVANKEVTRKLTIGKQGVDVSTNNIAQLVVDKFLERGLIPLNVKKSIPKYLDRKTAMINAIGKYMPQEYEYNNPEGGLFIWGRINAPIEVAKLLPYAVEKYNVAFIQGSVFFADGSGSETLRLNFSNASIEQIDTGVKNLGAMFKEVLARKDNI